jgi:hypothetical protein
MTHGPGEPVGFTADIDVAYYRERLRVDHRHIVVGRARHINA